MAEEDKKLQEKEETSEEIVKDIEKSGVSEKIAAKEEKLDEEIMKDVEKKAAEKKEETRPDKAELKKEEKAWKEFIIPLRSKFSKTARYRRTPKAIKAIKEFLVRHMKMYERDLKKVKLDKYLNEFIWTRGIRNPPSRVRIKAVIDGDVIRAELAELTERLRFKKEKLARRETRVPAQKKKEPEKVSDAGGAKTEEEKTEEKEKKASVVEAGQKMEKAAAKQAKHQSKVSKQPKRQRRMALQK